VFIKICGITTEDDALLAVAMGADAVGFVFAPSPRQIAVKRAYDISRRLPPEILTVGVFRDEHPNRVIEMVHDAGLKAAQLHGHESPADVAAVSASVRFVVKAVVAGSTDARHADKFGTGLVLLDAPAPGSGKVFDWSLAGDVATGPRIILAGGLTPDNVADAITQTRPWGVDVSSGVESEPGRKDPRLLRTFIAAARAAAPLPYVGPDDMPYDWQDDL
jgi:phosphoribosylanthranilate isomerase